MKLKEQVLTIEQAMHLQELGLDMIDAAHSWYKCTRNRYGYHVDERWTIEVNPIMVGLLEKYEIIPTYTLQEMIGKLPYGFEYFSLSYKDDCVGYYDSCGICYKKVYFLNDPLKAAYDMLCWVLENGYLKEDKNE